MENLDLEKFMVNADKPKGDNNYGWAAGDQLNALRYYLDPEKVTILAEEEVGWYQGECFAVFRVENRFVLWRDYFGSCSGCDGLEGSNGYDYIQDTLREGNTKQFESLYDAEKWISEKTEDYHWSSEKNTIIGLINKAKGLK